MEDVDLISDWIVEQGNGHEDPNTLFSKVELVWEGQDLLLAPIYDSSDFFILLYAIVHPPWHYVYHVLSCTILDIQMC